MRVEERLPAGAAQPNAETAETQRTRAAQSSERTANAGSSDRLQLSGLAERIRGVFDELGAAHAARVEQIGGEVRAGRYQVDVARLSRALAAEALR